MLVLSSIIVNADEASDTAPVVPASATAAAAAPGATPCPGAPAAPAAAPAALIAPPSAETAPAPAVTLDGELKRLGLEHVDVLKFSPFPDLVGALRGAKVTLAQSKAALVAIRSQGEATTIMRILSSAAFPTILAPDSMEQDFAYGLHFYAHRFG